jgi:tetratricopeptide (TPR) repeat protein
MSRLEQLLELLKAEPNDAFLRYGVAMEYAKASRFEDAMKEFEELLRRDANYVAAYFMAGRTQEQAGEVENAKSWYRRGIETATRVGDGHAAGEMAAALDAIS